MADIVTCPKCTNNVQRGSYPIWVIIVAIIFFPIGLLALLAGRQASVCAACGNAFVA